MVCSTAILTSSLALSLLRHSSSPNQSFVLSPFSLNTALSIVHDGANGKTQEELTNLLLTNCTPSDVTNFYSSLAISISSDSNSQVTFKSANRFYIDHSISLKADYQQHIEDNYNGMWDDTPSIASGWCRVRTLTCSYPTFPSSRLYIVENLNLRDNNHAADTMNNFVDQETNGMIKEIINADAMSNDNLAYLVNAIYFHGKWKIPFKHSCTRSRLFNGIKQMEFMSINEEKFNVNTINDFGTVLVLPYQDEKYNFFYLMPDESSNIDNLRKELTGERLLGLLRNAHRTEVTIIVPKFKLESEIDGTEVLKKMGVETLFNDQANLTKISDTRFRVSEVQHKAMIEMDEQGTTAAAVTAVKCTKRSAPFTIIIDRSFLFGIIRDEDILFLGQFV